MTIPDTPTAATAGSLKLGWHRLVPVAELRRLARLDPTPTPVDELATRRSA